MPLSTSNSEAPASPRRYTRPIVVALLSLLLLLLTLEVVTRVGFTRVSRIESRTNREYRAALATRPGGPARPTVLLLGNSLLLEGVDHAALRRATEPHLTPVRFVIEQTSYLDWYYGIRRLLADGARPDRIVLSLNLSQLLSPALRGEYSAYYLIQTPDLIRAGRDAHLDPTGISGLFFARYSMFYAGRNNFRNFILNTLNPAYVNLLHEFNGPPPRRPLSDQEVLARAAPRLKLLREACAEHQIAFDFLLPPGFEDGEPGLLAAGQSAGVPVLVPVSQKAWAVDQYRDGFHLSPQGAARFTQLLAAELRKHPD